MRKVPSRCQNARPRQRAQSVRSSRAIAERNPDWSTGLMPSLAILMLTCW